MRRQNFLLSTKLENKYILEEIFFDKFIEGKYILHFF